MRLVTAEVGKGWEEETVSLAGEEGIEIEVGLDVEGLVGLVEVTGSLLVLGELRGSGGGCTGLRRLGLGNVGGGLGAG